MNKILYCPDCWKQRLFKPMDPHHWHDPRIEELRYKCTICGHMKLIEVD